MIRLTFIMLVAGLASSHPAIAAEPEALATSIVRTADLDLSRASGRRLLDLRLSHAVADVCGEASLADLAGRNAVARCRSALVQQLHPRRDELIAKARRQGATELAAGR